MKYSNLQLPPLSIPATEVYDLGSLEMKLNVDSEGFINGLDGKLALHQDNVVYDFPLIMNLSSLPNGMILIKYQSNTDSQKYGCVLVDSRTGNTDIKYQREVKIFTQISVPGEEIDLDPVGRIEIEPVKTDHYMGKIISGSVHAICEKVARYLGAITHDFKDDNGKQIFLKPSYRVCFNSYLKAIQIKREDVWKNEQTALEADKTRWMTANIIKAGQQIFDPAKTNIFKIK